MTLAIAGKYATVQTGTGGTPGDTWADIQEVYEIGELPIERETYDVTSHGASYYREYIMGLFAPSSLTLSANYIEAQYDPFFFAAGSGNLNWYRIAYPADNSTHVFEAYISNISPANPLDDRLTYTMTLFISGPIARSTIT